MPTSCTAIKNMSISCRYCRNIFGSFIGHFSVGLYSNLFADAEDDSVVEVAGALHDEDGFLCLFPLNLLLVFVLGSFLVCLKLVAFSFPIVDILKKIYNNNSKK